MKLILFVSLIFLANTSIVPTKDRNTRIMGGKNADIHEFPYIVALVFNGRQQCGGSLISEYWVVTAAHCWFPIDDRFVIEYATAELVLFGEKARFAYPELFIEHEKYDDYTLVNDIGLIKLRDPVVSGFHNPFTKLAVPGIYYETGTSAVVAGWGIWSYENYTQPPLQKLDTQIWHHRDCQLLYKEYATPNDTVIYQTNICAGLPDFSKAHCSGDSGGPLLVNGVQVGIVSWSMKPCTVAQYPGVYTAVASYIDWISERTGLTFDMQLFLIRRG